MLTPDFARDVHEWKQEPQWVVIASGAQGANVEAYTLFKSVNITPRGDLDLRRSGWPETYTVSAPARYVRSMGARTVHVVWWTLFAGATLIACSKCDGAPSAKHFNCDKTPFLDEPERQCGSGKDCTAEKCFYPDHAYCFFYSTSWATVEFGQRATAIAAGRDYTPTPHAGTWSDKTLPMCTPTLDECNSFRNGVGKPNDQPPVKTPCRDTPAEQDPMTAPLPF